MPSIEVRDLQISYENARDGSRYVAADDIDFTVESGEFTTIVGPSGCGKSSLLFSVGGLITPSRGRISIDGQPVSGPGENRAMVFQEFGLLPWRSVLQNITFGLELRGVGKARRSREAKRLVELVGLTGFDDHYPHQLSGGMRQRVGIARALAVDPKILLMDEPFGALDAQTREIMALELLRIWDQDRKSVLFVTHSIDEAIFLADQIVVMTSAPGRVKEIVRVRLPRPRSVETHDLPEYTKLRKRLWSLLFDDLSGQSASTTEENLGRPEVSP